MTGPAIAERELAVPLLNESFEISPEEAVELWAEGVEMPPAPDRGRMDTDRIRRSADGSWVVRRDRHKGTFPSHDHTAEWALEQFERLQELGLNVISRGMTPSPEGETLVTVTPWLPDMMRCSEDILRTVVTPVLSRYFAGAVAGSIILADLRKGHQYSQLRSTGDVLLHDTDPYMCKAHGRTTRSL